MCMLLFSVWGLFFACSNSLEMNWFGLTGSYKRWSIPVWTAVESLQPVLVAAEDCGLVVSC